VGLLNQFLNALNSGASRSSVATAFVTDPRGYQAQIVADYNKVLAHDPDAGSLNFFTGYRIQGATNEAILAQLHGSSELLKHLEFFQSKTSLTDPNIAALTFRSGLEAQIQAAQTAMASAEPTPTTVQAVKDAQAAEMAAAQSATQAQKDADDAQMAANAAATSGDWITQLTNLKTLADGADTAAHGFVSQANTA